MPPGHPKGPNTMDFGKRGNCSYDQSVNFHLDAPPPGVRTRSCGKLTPLWWIWSPKDQRSLQYLVGHSNCPRKHRNVKWTCQNRHPDIGFIIMSHNKWNCSPHACRNVQRLLQVAVNQAFWTHKKWAFGLSLDWDVVSLSGFWTQNWWSQEVGGNDWSSIGQNAFRFPHPKEFPEGSSQWPTLFRTNWARLWA